MVASDIIWVTDGEDVSLPTEVEIPDWIDDVDEIADYLSDTYGFLADCFSLPSDGVDEFGLYVNEVEARVS